MKLILISIAICAVFLNGGEGALAPWTEWLKLKGVPIPPTSAPGESPAGFGPGAFSGFGGKFGGFSPPVASSAEDAAAPWLKWMKMKGLPPAIIKGAIPTPLPGYEPPAPTPPQIPEIPEITPPTPDNVPPAPPAAPAPLPPFYPQTGPYAPPPPPQYPMYSPFFNPGSAPPAPFGFGAFGPGPVMDAPDFSGPSVAEMVAQIAEFKAAMIAAASEESDEEEEPSESDSDSDESDEVTTTTPSPPAPKKKAPAKKPKAPVLKVKVRSTEMIADDVPVTPPPKKSKAKKVKPTKKSKKFDWTMYASKKKDKEEASTTTTVSPQESEFDGVDFEFLAQALLDSIESRMNETQTNVEFDFM